MKKENFTRERIENFQCEEGKGQSIFWDAKTPSLGLRITSNDARSFIFESRINGKTIRITIGNTKTWSVKEAQIQANKYKIQTDNGIDPRLVKAESVAKATLEKLEFEAAQLRDKVTLAEVWAIYIKDRETKWGERHKSDHEKMIKCGGIPRMKSNKEVTKDAPLASLAKLRLVDLSSERIEKWAETESSTRPTQTRLAWRMLKAFMTWCEEHETYGQIVKANTAKSKKIRENLGKPKVKNDVLQREQLRSWFSAVRQIANPVMSAYLQCLLITGARREEIRLLKWEDIDFKWKSLTIRDKVDGLRTIPLTPYIEQTLYSLPRRNQWVFSSPMSADGIISDPSKPHDKACTIAGLSLSIHGLRRSFASLCEWTETPAGIAAQIQGHKPQGVREQNYIRRPLDLLRVWHTKIEAWMLKEAQIEFTA
ncbi:integrase family protein [Undibacterium amnicola]|uniref:Integrase family protein n=1 Tax=Undibacterium amnicola TaxID=1834038 RepID=A0ABR6XPR4_9BURK|nr:integrase arm-type DNA-binding domain-containing protein [Undibacterium amnicola]MBC3831479.1 integrase family protein [Undibacterium amnicola]